MNERHNQVRGIDHESEEDVHHFPHHYHFEQCQERMMSIND